MRHKLIDITLVVILFSLSLYSYLSIGDQFIAVTENFERAILGFDSFAVTRVMCSKSFSAKYHSLHVASKIWRLF